MRFSVVIPTYNRLSLLSKALDSVLDQTFRNFEVIIIDDGSTDGTLDYLKSFGDQVKMAVQQNRGPGAARNAGISLAKGEYLAFLDSDDVWFPWALETYASVIDLKRTPAFIAGRQKRFCHESELSVATNSKLETNEFRDYLASGAQWRWWGVSSFVLQKEACMLAGGFTNKWINGEDADLALRLGVAHGFVEVKAPFTFGYREHAQSAMKNWERTLAGAWHSIQAEQRHEYPGGRSRRLERWQILTRHVRPVTIECLSHGFRNEAWDLYKKMFRWHVALGRWKYVFGFPFRAWKS